VIETAPDAPVVAARAAAAAALGKSAITKKSSLPNAQYIDSTEPPRLFARASTALRRPVPPSLSTPLIPACVYDPW
jgi:hypothetical protein